MGAVNFTIQKEMSGKLGRAGVLATPHGDIQTPAFVTVGTKGAVKALSPAQVTEVGAQVVLANTYHLYLEPGEKLVAQAGGLHKFMGWQGPTMTDSGGFQVFSLGAAFGKKIGKLGAHAEVGIATDTEEKNTAREGAMKPATIDEDGVTFSSYKDGSEHRFTPERSIAIQHDIGADMIFAFDECTSPEAPYDYQKTAMERTHRWAERSLLAHKANSEASARQGLFGIVQGGRHRDLREESARTLARMDFDGYGIGGSFEKKDMDTAVGWVSALLPKEKPRHLLGIGDPADLFGAVENGADIFDCVAPTRMARNGALYTSRGRINIWNARFREDFSPVDAECDCYTCMTHTRAYVAHLFRAREMSAGILASIHNLRFIIRMVERMRESILNDSFDEYKKNFFEKYKTADEV